MPVLKNRAKMSTSTTGTGTITLGSAEDGYQTFADAGVANGDVVRYVIEDGNNFEIGTGTYTSSGTTLSRTVSESSNSNNAINLSGSATVFIGAIDDDIAGGPRGVDFDDDVRVRFGAGNDLQIYHDGTTNKSHITESGASHLIIQGQEIQFDNAAGTSLLNMSASQIEMFHSGSKKLETYSGGIQTTGTVNVNNAYTLPTADGSANTFLKTDGSGALSFAAAGADLYTANPSSATNPTASGANAVAIGSNANASGSSAFAFGIARAQGANSFAVNLGNTGFLYKAGGTNSIAMGSLARAPDNHAIAIGEGAQTAAANSIALGSGSEASNAYSIALGGRYARTSADYSMATGYWSRSHVVGSKVHASGRFSSWGDAQTGTYVLRSDTTNATAEAMTADNGTASSSNQIVLQNESAISFTGTVVCREDATDGDDYAGWEIKGVIMRQGAAADTSLGVGIVNKLYASSGISAADVALSADASNGCLKIQVTGVASTNLNWVATVNTSEVINA